MGNSNSSEESKEEKKKKKKTNKTSKNNIKQKKEKEKEKKQNNNILDDLKDEENTNNKEKILEEINNTLVEENSGNKKRKPQKDKKEEKEEKQKKEKKEEKEEKQKVKNTKKKKKNIISDTFNEIDNELNEQYNLEVENIFEINAKFNYPKDSPLFYIREDSTNSDLYPYPLSASQLKECLKNKEIKPFLVKVKLIDIFIMNNYEPFSYFDFNDILTKNWAKNVEHSALFLSEYINLREKQKKEEKFENLSISKKQFQYSVIPNKPKKLKFDDDKKVENKNKENDMSLNLDISALEKSLFFNDNSISIIKHLQGANLNKKQVEKINSIIEEVEEDDWVEVKNNKKKDNKDEQPFTGIVGLNESKQFIELDKDKESSFKVKNKKNRKKNNKKNNTKCINFNNKFASLKVNRDSDDDEDD
jgi:hypothetical protein